MLTLMLFDQYIGVISGATTPGQSGPGSNGNEGVLCITHYSNLTIRLFSVITWTLIGKEVLSLCRVAVSVFYSPSQLSKFKIELL